jgi:hypothetical protein
VSPDISGIVKSTGVALEQQAFAAFGAAIGGLASGALGSIFGQTNPPGAGPTDAQTVIAQQDPQTRISDSTRYAAALTEAFQVDFDPKLKFLFKVSFTFHPALNEYIQQFGTNVTTRDFEENLTFMVTQIDRPQVDFEYEEVNMYNYRTHVLTRIKHRELSMTLTDDVGNRALDFANIYRMIYQPISRPVTDAAVQSFDRRGMEFTPPFGGLDGGGLQAIPASSSGVANQPLTRIRISQIFVERGSWYSDPKSWVKVVHFDFINPRITNINMDDLDYSSGGGPSNLSLSFNFDALHMSYAQQATLANTAPVMEGKDILSEAGNYDSSVYRNETASPGGQSLFGNFAQKATEMIGNQAIRAANQSVSNFLLKTLGKTPGGTIVAGELSRVGQGLATQAQKSLFSATKSIFSTGAVFGTAPPAPVKDSSTGGSPTGTFP